MKATLFKEVGYSLSKLIEDIDAGEIGLPDIQRPFVWTPTKVRDLFDSMYNGFPVGYLLFWASQVGNGARQIGLGDKRAAPRLLIVDGQQRLTSLYAVLRGRAVLDENYQEQSIKIAFRPRDSHFAVLDAAVQRDPEFIPNISELWVGDVSRNRFVKNFVERLRSTRELTEADEDHVTESIDRLYDLQSYPFTALELSASLEEERVAEVFVRINSKGVTLNQADFILTLMSVFWDEGRKELETFSHSARQPPTDGRPSPYNHFIQPAPDQLLRVGVGLGFRRGQLRAVYALLRGRDLETDQYSAEHRDAQFRRLQEAQSYLLDVTRWHEFMHVLVRAGFRSGSMITSQNALLYSYTLYLIGRRDFDVDRYELRELIARWFFMSSLTGRYTSSPESAFESDLARLRELKTADDFTETLDQVIEDTLTSDFWQITLPNRLATSAPRSPALYAYYAALNLLDARVLFSKLRVNELFDPALKPKRSAMERHHLFPRSYLQKLSITAIKDVNQIANLALVEWPDNTAISGSPPSEYFERFMSRLDPKEAEEMRFWHALPEEWELMSYQEFLPARRRLLSRVINAGFERLRGTGEPDPDSEEPSVNDLLLEGEGGTLEFKSSARWNYKRGDRDPEMEMVIVKAIAGFMNSASGGTLLIGVDDGGNPIGLERDFRLWPEGDRDQFELWLTDLLSTCLGRLAPTGVRIRFAKIDGHDVCRVGVQPSPRPVFLNPPKGERTSEFWVRINNSTRRLMMDEVLQYEKERWSQSPR